MESGGCFIAIAHGELPPMGVLWRLIFTGETILLMIWQILCPKLGEGSASMARRRYLISDKNYTIESSPWARYPRNYNLTKTRFVTLKSLLFEMLSDAIA